MNIRCSHCHAEVAKDLAFCPHCGAAIPQPEPGAPRAFNFWSAALQGFLALGAVIFGGVGACSIYALATGDTSSEMGDLSQAFWIVGIFALGCGALCIYLGALWKKKRKK